MLKELQLAADLKSHISEGDRRADLGFVVAADGRHVCAGRRRSAGAKCCGSKSVGGETKFVGIGCIAGSENNQRRNNYGVQ